MSQCSVLCSTLSKKFLMAVSGILLVLFLISHLSANLTLISPNSEIFNTYVATLWSFGWLIYVAEFGLLFIFILHIVTAIQVSLQNKKARGINYKVYRTKGGPSKSNLASRNMRISGLLILVFLIVHIWQFRFGAGVAEGYVTDLNGEQARDLYRLVVETFQNPLIVIFYTFSMIVLGMHLRHAFWSAFQSSGLVHSKINEGIYKISCLIAFIFAVGFGIIPLWIYIDALGVYS